MNIKSNESNEYLQLELKVVYVLVKRDIVNCTKEYVELICLRHSKHTDTECLCELAWKLFSLMVYSHWLRPGDWDKD